MNSSTSEALWPTPVAAHEVAAHISDTQHALIALVATNILASVSAGTFTASTAVSGQTSVDVQYVTALLNQGGYAVANDGTSIIASW